MKFEKIALAGLVVANNTVSGQNLEKVDTIDNTAHKTEASMDNNKTYTSSDYQVSIDELREASKKEYELKIDNIDSSIEKDFFKQEALKYKEYGMLMSCNFASEKPNEYQERQIKELQDEIILNLESKKFNSISELITYINQSVDNNFTNNTASINLKDAFPEKEGEKAKGSFDCDSRSIFSLSILEKIGINNDKVGFYMMEGHALLKDKIENKFIEMTTNKPFEMNKDSEVQLEEINSFDKFYSYLLAKEGVNLSYAADINLFDPNGKKDTSKMDLAFQKIREASELDPNNLTTNLNLLRILSKVKLGEKTLNTISSTASSNIERSLINNFYGIDSEDAIAKNMTFNIGEIKRPEIKPRKLKDLGDFNKLTSKAIRQSEYLQSKFFDLGSDMYYKFNNKEEAIRIFTNLSNSIDAESINKDKTKEGMYLLYQRYISKSYFDSERYEEYLKFENIKLYNKQSAAIRNKNLPEYMISQIKQDMIEQETEIMVANIITGHTKIDESSIDDFCKTYSDDPVINHLIKGTSMSSALMSANEALVKWSGYQNMVNSISLWKEKNSIK